MVLVDTSVWVNHLYGRDTQLLPLLDDSKVLTHPLVVGELECGQVRDRSQFLRDLADLPRCKVASHDEVTVFLRSHRLHGRGIGIVDVHLLASTAMSECKLLSADKRLKTIASDLELAYTPGV